MGERGGGCKTNPRAFGIGRKRGTPNKLTRAGREAFELAFQGLGGVTGLIAWAKKNRGSFYHIYARLLPTEHRGAPLVNINLSGRGEPIRDASQAAAIYAQFIGNPELDLAGIKFEPPALPPPVVEPAIDVVVEPRAMEPVDVAPRASAPTARVDVAPESGESNVITLFERLSQ